MKYLKKGPRFRGALSLGNVQRRSIRIEFVWRSRLGGSEHRFKKTNAWIAIETGRAIRDRAVDPNTHDVASTGRWEYE